jgi:hypothetical protein
VRRAILRGVSFGLGSALVFLVASAVAGGARIGALLFWGFLVGLVATPIAFAEIVLRRWAANPARALAVAGFVFLIAWLGVSASWVQANWTLAMLAAGDADTAFAAASRALGQIFDDEGVALTSCLAPPFALVAFARLRRWALWGQGLLAFAASLLVVGAFELGGFLRGDTMFAACLILAGGLAFFLPLASAGTDVLERRIWGRAESQ